MTTKDVLIQCTVSNNIVFLPDIQLDRKLYEDVAKALKGIGGSWNRKSGGFVFPAGYEESINELLGRVQDGEKLNLKKEFQFFETPEKVAKIMAEYLSPEKGQRILEPSAGRGALIKAVRELFPFVDSIDYCEIMKENINVLRSMQNLIWIGDDFLKRGGAFSNYYDRIIANPPFAKNQDIDHIYKMYEVLAPGGRIVTIASNHWDNSNNSKERIFADWLNRINAEVYPLSAGEFKDSGTMIATNIIVINK